MAAWLLWHLRGALLLTFGAILVALLLRALAARIARWTRLPEGLGLAAAIVVIAAAGGLAVWLSGSQLPGQMSDVLDRVHAVQDQVQNALESYGIGGLGSDVAAGGQSLFYSSVEGAFGLGFGLVKGSIVLAVAAVYLAAQPGLYRRGLEKLVVPRLRAKTRETLDLIGVSLRLWMVGQLVLMALVGALSFGALWLIGLPSPLALGLIAGLTEMVPYIGPIIGAVPALLVAVTQGMEPALWTLAAYLAIHVLEGYIVAPLIQRHFVTIPPALALLGIVVGGLLFGVAGVVFAAPMTIAAFVAVKLLYVRDVLDTPTEVPGDSDEPATT